MVLGSAGALVSDTGMTDGRHPSTGRLDMISLDKLQADAATAYRAGAAVPNHIELVVECALGKLATAGRRDLGKCNNKQYNAFEANGNLSRPVYMPFLMNDIADFRQEWKALRNARRPADRRYDFPAARTNRVLYTASMAFAACYDLWRPTSRKTPGTFFEVVLGSVLQEVLPGRERTAHVILPGQAENVSTDIVFLKPGGRGGLVVPAKITTRERIVQPYAHQRILDSIFGIGSFRSVLTCMSEMQRAGEVAANAICVPGTIRLFQLHLAQLSGIYYLDPPARYLEPDVAGTVTVDTIGALLTRDLPGLTT
jgi:hypothetical protein